MENHKCKDLQRNITMAKPSEVMALIVAHAAYYERTLSDEVVEMYVNDLCEFSLEQLKSAYATYRNDPKNFRNPIPAQIKAIINPKTDSRKAAADLAQRLCSFARKKDYTWAMHNSFRKEFLLELGEIAWNVVQKRGGWNAFCDEFWNSDNTAFSAQLRDVIEFEWESHSNGNLRPMHALPEPNKAMSRFDALENLIGTQEAAKKLLNKPYEN